MGDAGTGRATHGSRVQGKGRVAALYLALTLPLAYPFTANLASRAVPGGADTDLFMWTLAWDAHAFVHQPLSIFDANIYYPQRRTLAYSENLIGSAVFAAPILWITDNPVLALNVVTLLSVVLCGLGAYVLARRVSVGPAGAILCGLIFAFSPARFFRIGQLHLTTVQWMPFGLASLHAYLDGGRKLDLRLAAAFFTLQALTSGHGAVFLAVATLGLLGYRVALGEPVAVTRRLRDLGVPGALLLAPSALIVLPYRHVQAEMGLRRSLVNWAPTPESFLASPAHVQMFLVSLVTDARINETASAFLFPGYLPLLLAAAAFLWRGRSPFDSPFVLSASTPGRLSKDERLAQGRLVSGPHARHATVWARVAFLLEIAVLVSLAVGVVVTVVGPIRLRAGSTLLFVARNARRAWTICAISAALRIALVRRAPFAPLPRLRRRYEALRRWLAARRGDMITFYGLLTILAVLLAAGPPIGLWPLVYWLPGLNFIRAPSRFMILAVLGLAVLAGIGFERLSARLAPKRRLVFATTVGALLVAEFATLPVRGVPYRVEIPAVDRWLARQPTPFVVAEVPLLWTERLQTAYMLHSMAHWQKTVHGYSGLRPPLHEDLYRQLRNFPDEKGLYTLWRLGVGYVVVHTDAYPPGEWATVEERIGQFRAWLTLEHAEGAGRVYSLRGPPGDARR